ncbi:hypothetical protein ASG90_05930 [Nocardioides sp. Soil797]|nr:hypothetical protein ASG90_05930 [Nocardioides sp. Soil797]
MAALLLVSGCNGDSDASDEPTKTFTPMVSPTLSEPTSTYTRPEPAKPPKDGWPEDKPVTEISAEQVARIWVEAYSAATVDGDLSRMRALGTAGCRECKRWMADIREDFEAGVVVRTKGKPFTTGRRTMIDVDSPNRVEIRLSVRSSAGERIENPPAADQHFAAEDYEWFFILTMVQQQWRVADVGFAE